MNDLVQIISTVGFPIFSFLICAYGLKYSYDKSLEQNKNNIDTLSELSKSINHNTEVLTELVVEVKHLDEKEK